MNQVQMRQFCRKVVNGSRFTGVIRSLGNGRGVQLECVMFLHEPLLVAVLMYGSEIIWEK